MKIFPIHTGLLKLDGGTMFGVVPKVMWEKHYPADNENFCTWAMRCLLVDTGDRKILIDTGLGDKQDDKFVNRYHIPGPYSLESSLNEAGYRPGDITDIIHTHLHFDHCGGTIRRNQENNGFEPVFPNAYIWVSREHFIWAIHPNDREKPSFPEENILPLKESGRLRLIEKERELFHGIDIRFFNGHTRGQIIPHIRYNDKTIVFMGDLIPSLAHVILSFNMAYDIDPLTTLKEKKEFLAEAAEKNYILFFEHDFRYECCTVKETSKGIVPDRISTLKELTS